MPETIEVHDGGKNHVDLREEISQLHAARGTSDATNEERLFIQETQSFNALKTRTAIAMTRTDTDRSRDYALIENYCWEMQRTKAVIFAVTQVRG